MKIRIGNDIKLVVDVRQYDSIRKLLKEHDVYDPENPDFESMDEDDLVNKSGELYDKNGSTIGSSNLPYVREKDIYFNQNGTVKKVKRFPINIQSVKAILVNTSRERELNEEIAKKTRFVSRFPIEPCVAAYDSTPYNVCNSGYPAWRAYPLRHGMFPYHGFGIHPQFDGIYAKLPRINDTEYVAEISATINPNIINVFFPAECQLYTGTYKLVLVIKLYEPGYRRNNLRTVTIDMDNVFELVNTSNEAIDDDVIINVYRHLGGVVAMNNNDLANYADDIFIYRGKCSDDELHLNRTDGSKINIDIRNISGWYEGE